MTQDGRVDEADEYLPLIGQLAGSDVGFALAFDVMMGTDQLERAESFARSRVERDPADELPLLALARVLMQRNKLQEAEQHLLQVANSEQKKLVTIALLSLFDLYVRQGENVKADAVTDRLINNAEVELGEGQRCFVKAQTLELLKDPNAAAWYEKAIQAEPDNPNYLSRAAVYAARMRDDDLAISYARKVRQIPGADNAEARALLVTLLAERGSDADWEEMDRLKGSFLSGDADGSDMDRLYAMLYTIRKSSTNSQRQENLDNALRLLEEIGDDVVSGSAANHLALARVYQQLREIEIVERQRQLLTNEALKHYLRAADTEGVKARQLQIVADFLLKENELRKAKPLIDRLVKLDADNIGVESQGTLNRSALLVAEGLQDEAKQAIKEYVDQRTSILTKNRHPELYQEMGDICLAAKMLDEAEKWYKQGDDGSLGAFRKYVITLMQQDRIEAAIRICENRFIQDPQSKSDLVNNRFVIQLISGLLSSRPRPRTPDELFESAEPVIAAVQEQLAGSADVLNAIATIRLVSGNCAEAIDLYRGAVKADSENAVYLNNLATALGIVYCGCRRSDGFSGESDPGARQRNPRIAGYQGFDSDP